MPEVDPHTNSSKDASRKLWLAKFLASCGGIGHLPGGPGTYASMLCVGLWYGLWHFDALAVDRSFQYLFAAPLHWEALVFSASFIWVLFLAGIWSTTKVQGIWGKDPSQVVIDEVLGQAIALAALPWHPLTALGGLLLFRFFDIAKPMGIRRMERLPGAWGVMLDDALAGLYANIVLQVLWYSGLFVQLARALNWA